jgi:tetratricopeptide (TPR) repeat protein
LFAGLAWAIVRFETDRRYIWIPAAGAAALLAFLLRRRPLRFGPAVGALLVVSRLCSATHVPVLYASRSFFGILRVESIPWLASNKLLHGSTVHGMQSRDPDRRREPLTYFHRTGPLGKVFAAISERPEFTAGGRIGIIGLGTGAVSAYGTPGQHVTYYEIDPAVERIARDPRLFTYVSDSLAQTDVILGDARLSLEHGPSRQFDLLIVDAFSSDYIPVHLLTTEAIHLYQSHLADRGLLALHISNRYLDLKPVVRKLAEQAHAVARFCADTLVENYPGKYASTWVVVAAREEDLGKLYRDPAWQPLPSERDQRLWTDDFSNVLGAMRWEFGSQPVEPARRRGAADANAFMKAFRLYGQGHIPEAVAEFRGIVERNPDDTSARRYLGEILLEQGQADEAIVHFRKAAEVAPLSAQSQLDLGGALARQQRDTEAISHLRKALELDPRSAEAHRQIANVLIRQNEADQAIEHYRKALEINPRDAKTHTNPGLALWTHKGRVNDAIAHFREALAIDPRYEAARKNLDLAEKENPRNRNEDAR